MMKRKAAEASAKASAEARGMLWLDLTAMLGVYFVAAPFALRLLGGIPRIPTAVLFGLALVVFAAGWGIQDWVCRLSRHARPREGSGYEKGHKYYHIGLALPVWGGALLLWLFLPRAVDRYLYFVSANSLDYLYDEFSVFPPTAAAAAAVLLLLGSGVRFYPYTRVLSPRACMTYLTLFLVGFVLGGGNLSALCLAGFALCAALLLNQSALERGLETLSLPYVPRETRAGGVRSVLWLGGIFLACAAGMSILVGGGLMLGRMLLFMLLKNRVSSDGMSPVYSSADEAVGDLRRFLVQGEENPVLNVVLMVLFFLGLVALVLWLALRHNEAVRRYAAGLWQRVAAFIDWLFGMSTRIYYRASSLGDEVSYRDELKKLKRTGAWTGAAQASGTAGMHSWREFRSVLAAQQNDEARLTYAYGVLAAVLRAQPAFPLLRSDTPRRIEQKVRARGRHDELREITAVFELINYAGRSPGSGQLSRALEMTCGILREYFG